MIQNAKKCLGFCDRAAVVGCSEIRLVIHSPSRVPQSGMKSDLRKERPFSNSGRSHLVAPRTWNSVVISPTIIKSTGIFLKVSIERWFCSLLPLLIALTLTHTETLLAKSLSVIRVRVFQYLMISSLSLSPAL